MSTTEVVCPKCNNNLLVTRYSLHVTSYRKNQGDGEALNMLFGRTNILLGPHDQTHEADAGVWPVRSETTFSLFFISPLT